MDPLCSSFEFVAPPRATSQRAFGQVDEGAISGTIQDTTGAIITNAKVTLLNTDQGLTLETTTTSGGTYSFSPVRIGNYSISVTAPGFQKTTQEHLVVAVSQTLQVNVQLRPGAATETVEVTSAPPQLQTDDSSVGQVVTEQSVNNLPLNGRNFTFLAQLSAGVNTPQADTRGNAASGAFSANGLRPSQNNYLLDGIDNNSDTVDFLNGTNFIILPPIDAIQEFKVQTADFSAELGRSAGAVLNATIKSGTNSIHGAVWEFFRNDVLDAADWFEDNGGVKKGELRWNQFGASIGGPIIKNKLFYFGDYEGFRRVQGTVSTGYCADASGAQQRLHESHRHHQRKCLKRGADRRPGTIDTAGHNPGSCDNAGGHRRHGRSRLRHRGDEPAAMFAIRSVPAELARRTLRLPAAI